MRCTVDNYNYLCHICAKGFLDLKCAFLVIDKIYIFYEIALNFAYFQNRNL